MPHPTCQLKEVRSRQDDADLYSIDPDEQQIADSAVLARCRDRTLSTHPGESGKILGTRSITAAVFFELFD